MKNALKALRLALASKALFYLPLFIYYYGKWMLIWSGGSIGIRI